MLLYSPMFVFSLLAPFLFWRCEGATIKVNNHNSSLVSNDVAKRQYSSNAAANKEAKRVVATFRETVIRVLLYNKHPVLGHFGGIASAFLLNLIIPQSGSLSVWEQVENQVKNMVHDKLNDNNIALLRDDWNKIGEALQNASKQKEDINLV